MDISTAEHDLMENVKPPTLRERDGQSQVRTVSENTCSNGQEIHENIGAAIVNSAIILNENNEDRGLPHYQPTGKFWNKPFGYGVPMGRGRGGSGFYRGRGGVRLIVPHHDVNWQAANEGNNFNGSQLELWVETKSEDSKAYYYHAITRETTWTKPEGQHIKIVTQLEIEEMNQKNQQMQHQHQLLQEHNNQNKSNRADPNNMITDNNAVPISDARRLEVQHVNMHQQHQMPPHQPPQMPLHLQQPNHPQQSPQMIPSQPHIHPPPQHQQPPPYFHGMHPTSFNQPPFGMPPPGYSGFQGAWSMPWGMQHHNIPTQEKPAKNLIIKPGVIDPTVIARAAEWSEHRAPDGRPYYYHATRGESVWEKPQAIRDLEAARMAAHSGAAPQQTSHITQAQHMMANPHMHMPVQSLDSTMAYNTQPKINITKPVKMAEIKENKERSIILDAERKKKEDDKKNAAAANAPNKPIDKSRPISSTAIVGTPWCVVWTGDGRVFFYNPSSRTSVWERPEELLQRDDVDKAISTVPEQLKGTVKTDMLSSDLKLQIKPAAIEINTKPIESINIRTDSESSADELITRKKSSTESKVQKKSPVDSSSDAAIEAEVRAAKERALVPLDTRIKQFTDMLREKDVSAFSTWEKELHKIVFDPRYLLLTSKERKQVFEKYVKDRAEEERKEKRNKMRQKRDEFRKLMDESNLNGKSSFSDFSQRYGRDERFRAIEKVRERESLFNEFIVDVRRQEKEDKIIKKEQIKKEFMQMLRNRSDLDRHSRWQDVKKKIDTDDRFRAVESSTLREDYFLDFIKMIKEDRKKKDKERERDRDRGRERDREKREKKYEKKDRERTKDRSKEKSSYEKSVEQKRDDRDEDNEGRKSSDDETERLQKERDRQMRAEQSIREREKEVQRTLAGHLRDRDKEREHHIRDEAIRHFSALLVDLVRNPNLTWREVKKQLRKDHRWEAVEALEREEREKIFNEHIDALMKKKREKFREMLNEIPTLTLTSTWKDTKKLIRDDPRYLKYNNTDKCEREFRDYIKDKTATAKSNLRELLQECKLISYKTIDVINEHSNHLKEIEDILKNDKRYLVLDHLAADRTQIIMTYLEDLHKRGPPPPPTASESTRRNK